MMNFMLPLLATFQLTIAIDNSNLPLCQTCKCIFASQYSPAEVNCQRPNNIKEIFSNSTWFKNSGDNSTIISYPYSKVTIENGKIQTLEFQFPDSNLTYLSLAHNGMEKMKDSTFLGLENMEVLILSYNNFENIQPDAFKGKFVEGRFLPLKSLKELRLDHNVIRKLDENIFEHLSMLEILDLSYNPLKQLKDSQIAISSLLSLKEFYVSHTDIDTLPEYFMDTHKKLEVLDMSDNPISTIPTTLSKCKSLRVLNLNTTTIVNITQENGFFKIKIPTLKILHLCDMPNLENIYEHSLSGLMDLEELYISSNIELSYIHPYALATLSEDGVSKDWPHIRKLSLANNKLSYLESELVLNWETLVDFNINDNPWSCECENQWFVDELMPVYIRLNPERAKQLRCASPKEMTDFTFYGMYEEKYEMRCLDRYGATPERDAILLVGILTGLLITIPLVLFILYAYQRSWFGFFSNSPAAYSRQFYRRQQSANEYL